MESSTGLKSQDRAFLPPPLHPSLRTRSSSTSANSYAVRSPKLPRRQPVVDLHPLPVIDSSELTSESSESLVLPKAEQVLSETQLRQLYDDEEIDRFLHIFAAYVREVTASDIPATHVGKNGQCEFDESVDEWAPLDQDAPSPPPSLPRYPPSDISLSERIALNYIVPLLPAVRPPPPKFTVQRLKLTVQRIYLATKPAYGPFLRRLITLATWEDRTTSLMCCSAYWFLWYLNLLLPSLILRILYSLFRRKALPYPTLAELRRHWHEVELAKEFSVAVTVRLAAAPTHDVQDVWNLFQLYVHTRKSKKAAKSDVKASDSQPDDVGSVAEGVEVTPEEHTGPDDTQVDPDEPDAKAIALNAINEISDLHERVKNTFLWRRPSSSVKYGIALFFVFLLTLLPAKYLAKLSGFVCGVAFWHVVPILVAIPSSDRARIPVPFSDVPTDADYAMDLISQRVARGLDVKPKRRESGRNSPDRASISTAGETEDGERSVNSSGVHTSVNWRKWGDRVVTTKERTSDLKRLFQGGQWKRPENWMALNPLSPQVALQNGSTESRLQAYTFPAQYAKATGLITLTPTTLIFTSLLSNTARLSISTADILGVKKSGAMRGLNVRWMEVHDDGQGEEREAKFLWVGGRNELFARLIGLGGRRWAKV
ncbi:hypothetical protein BKA93DRAFT_722328 [Sparassis latifolia]